MEPPVEVTFESAGRHPAGWQVQQRVDVVVNRVLRTHRGLPVDEVDRALRQGLLAFGVVPNKRQVAAYAAQISALAP